ncbi:MAG: hypothetical protein C0421_05810 [Hyphomonas sp.]|uniref:hypothetical protein n=1 Tax=Hyphomonas sp. TaxID=87 RepID=UPI0025C1065A|nr:hypothetical protein [Hyphomonas sp.]MBA4338342.1 hypothetical protein [Hyphomonas sp.]
MNRTLSEINAIIEAEVERRCASRFLSYSRELRAMADSMGSEEFGGPRPQMTDGIEITPPASSFEKAQAEGRTISRAVVEVTLAPESLKSLEAHIDQVVAEAQLETETADAPARTAPEEAEPAAKPAVETKPEWYAAATKAAKSPKLRQIIDQLATDGDITLNGVIYAFRPPIKEAYALNFVSDVRRCLKAAGWDLVRGNDGAYRAQVAQ